MSSTVRYHPWAVVCCVVVSLAVSVGVSVEEGALVGSVVASLVEEASVSLEPSALSTLTLSASSPAETDVLSGLRVYSKLI